MDTKYFTLKYDDGRIDVVSGKNALEVIKHYDLATRKHINTRVFELSGEQEAIARSNEQ